MRRSIIAFGAIAALATFGAAGCGGDDNESSTSADNETAETTTTANAANPATVSGAAKIVMTDYKFDPAAVQTAPGTLTISAPNEGQVVHELVLAKTDLAADALPTEPSGDVNEDKLDIPGEIADVEPGKTKSTEFKDLKAGKYVMFCNVAGHYKAGMYGTLVVQ